MFGIGIGEVFVICLVALLFFGPDKLPEIMKQVGKIYVFMRRQSNDFKEAFDKVVREAETEILAKEREKIKKLIESATTLDAPKKLEAEGHSNQDHPHDAPKPYVEPAAGDISKKPASFE